jgi:RHS repeat-associated protein
MNINALSSSAPMSMPNRFKYNGKELNEEFDLNWYSYGAREYMSDIARWNGVDPLSYRYLEYSPYHYSYNSPLNFRDPDGRKIVDANGNEVGIEIGEDKKGRQTISYTFAEGTSKKVMRKFRRNAGFVLKQAIQTAKGMEVVKDAIDSNDNIHINYSSSTKRSKNGSLHLGATRMVSTRTPFDPNNNKPLPKERNIEVNIWAGSINELSSLDKRYLLNSQSKQTRELWDKNKLSHYQKVGAVGVHELTHATTPAHLTLRRKLTTTEHAIAYKNEEEAIKQYGKKNNK